MDVKLKDLVTCRRIKSRSGKKVPRAISSRLTRLCFHLHFRTMEHRSHHPEASPIGHGYWLNHARVILGSFPQISTISNRARDVLASVLAVSCFLAVVTLIQRN